MTIEEIQKKVAEHYSIRLTDMSSADARGGGAAAPGGDVSGEATHQPQPARNRPEIRQSRPHHGDARRVACHRTDGTDGKFAEDVELLRRLLEA